MVESFIKLQISLLDFKSCLHPTCNKNRFYFTLITILIAVTQCPSWAAGSAVALAPAA